MSDEPIHPPPPRPEEKPAEPSAIAPPVIFPSAEAPPIIPQGKPASPANFNQWLVYTIRVLFAISMLAIVAMLFLIPSLYIDNYWEEDKWHHVLQLLIALSVIPLITIRFTNAKNVITIFRCIIAFGIPVLGGLALVIPRFFWDDWNWREVWMVILLVCCGLFAVMAVLVIIGGAFDVRKLLRRLREQETGGEPDTSE